MKHSLWEWVIVTDPWTSLSSKSSKLIGFKFSEKKKKKNILRWRVAEERQLIPTSTLYRYICTYSPPYTHSHTKSWVSSWHFHTQMCIDYSHFCYPLAPTPRWSLSIFNTLKELLHSLPSQYFFIAPMVCNDSLFHIPKALLAWVFLILVIPIYLAETF